jgi:hypothetical protein
MNENKTPSWSDRKYKYSDIWMDLLKRASILYTDGQFQQYYRCIDTLIRKLYTSEREIIVDWLLQYQENHNITYKEDRIEYYTKLEEQIIKLLEDRGYIQYQETIEEGTNDV